MQLQFTKGRKCVRLGKWSTLSEIPDLKQAFLTTLDTVVLAAAYVN